MVPETIGGLGGVGIDVQRSELEMQIRALPEGPGTHEDSGAAKFACPNRAFNRNHCCPIPALEMNTGIQSGRNCDTINPGSSECVRVER
jgi:hypothetical protein